MVCLCHRVRHLQTSNRSRSTGLLKRAARSILRMLRHHRRRKTVWHQTRSLQTIRVETVRGMAMARATGMVKATTTDQTTILRPCLHRTTAVVTVKAMNRTDQTGTATTTAMGKATGKATAKEIIREMALVETLYQHPHPRFQRQAPYPHRSRKRSGRGKLSVPLRRSLLNGPKHRLGPFELNLRRVLKDPTDLSVRSKLSARSGQSVLRHRRGRSDRTDLNDRVRSPLV